MQEQGATTAEFQVTPEAPPRDWFETAREQLSPGSCHLLGLDDDGEILDFAMEIGWTRIGRSIAADVQLDDPSVSRRHALVVSEPGEALRVLDDRSLNGVLVNGEPVEWGRLEHGDELTIGRYRLFVAEG